MLTDTDLPIHATPPGMVTTSVLRRSDPLLEIAMKLEEVALKDDYFVSRHLYPNVDFYSGIVLRALGIPVSMYTVLFAVRTCTKLTGSAKLCNFAVPADAPELGCCS